MKLLPWCCLVAATYSPLYAANDNYKDYRLGNYARAAKNFAANPPTDVVGNYYLGLMRAYGYGELKNDAMALRYLTQAASKGYLPAEQLLAHYYLIKENNPEVAFLWFKSAAALNDTSALMYCAGAYLFGYGVKKNTEAAKHYYIEAAKNGNALAQYTLAMNFLESRDSRNKKMGAIWLTKSAAQGNVKAMVRLGELYAEGQVVKKDLLKAKDLLTSAAKQNYLPAMVILGNIAKKQNDLPSANAWFTQAANSNSAEAQYALANLYKDANIHDSAFLWMLKAAQNGYYAAQLALAKMYKEGFKGEANAVLAEQWEKIAQKTAAIPSDLPSPKIAMAKWLSNDQTDRLELAGYPLTGIYSPWQNPLALKENNYNQPPHLHKITRREIYKPQFNMVTSDEIPINDYFDILASRLTKETKDENHWTFLRYPLDKAMNALLRNESLVLKHEKNAPWISKSTTFFPENTATTFDYLAEQTKDWEVKANYQAVLTELYEKAILGNPTAQFELGQLYQYGVGVKQNYEQAINYYELASIQQEVKSEYNLAVLYLEGKTNPINYKKGVEWLMSAAFKGNAYAQYALANLYEKGFKDTNGNVILPANPNQALAMYYLASSNHLGEAEYRLADYLVHYQKTELNVAAKQMQNNLIKRLYEDAAKQGIAEAVLPLAFYYAMDTDPTKQQQALKIAKEEAETGNPEAALLLGIMYSRGIAVTPNMAQALYWYQKAGDNPVSNFILGTNFSTGIGLNKDVQKGRTLLQQSAQAGFSYAYLNLAILKREQGESFLAELDSARNLGNSKAGLLLADYYLFTADNLDNIRQAREIYQYFADKGDKDAELKLAFLYDYGLDGQVNKPLAEQWYLAAANQGQAVAQYLLGQLYQLGEGSTLPNYVEAKKWFTLARATYSPAAVALGFLYETVDNNYSDAFQNYRLASEKGDALGDFNLGLIYENGKGRAVNNQQAKVLYLKAAEKGNANAMAQLAGLYFRGVIGSRDDQKAIFWYKKAADLKNAEALYHLGLFSETGVATKLDFANAIKFYHQAANLGNDKAKLALARMYQYGVGVEKDPNYVLAVYKELAAKGNAFAQYQLALLFLQEKENPGQMEQGRQWLQQAADNGNHQARKLLQWLNAQHQDRLSFIEPIMFSSIPTVGQSADLMYFDALSEWNRGNETSSRQILDQLLTQFPQYVPAKRAYEQLKSAMKSNNVTLR